MKHSIKSKILFVLFIQIVALVVISSVILISSHLLITKYENTSSNMSREYELIDVTNKIIASFNFSIKNTSDESRIAVYTSNKQRLRELFTTLDTTIVSADSLLVYKGLKSTINEVVSDCDSGLEAVKKGDITTTYNFYESANRKNEYVRENTAELILRELDYLKLLQSQLFRTQLITQLAIMAFALLTIIGVAIYTYKVANRIVKPLLNLTALSKDIIKGNYDVAPDSKLLKSEDETGVLANSLAVMIDNLKKKINELSVANKKLDEEKKKIEEKIELRTHELVIEHQKLLTAINNAPYGLLLLDTKDNVVLANDAVKDILDIKTVTLEEIYERTKNKANIKEDYQDVLNFGTSVAISSIAVGNKIVDINLAKVSVEDSGVIGVIITIMDVTAERILENSKDELLTIVTHELRTPLTAIEGNLLFLRETLYKTLEDSQAKSSLEDIFSATDRMVRIVNEFLLTSKLEKGKMKFENTAFSIDRVIINTLKEWEALLSKHNITLFYESPKPEDEYIAYADPEKITQVLSNLISNAIKYANPEKGTITINVGKKYNFIQVEVIDNGAGIPEDKQHLLFRKFQQAGSMQGTGLGLYICKLMIESMGGSIALKTSNAESGSSFIFTIPAQERTSQITG